MVGVKSQTREEVSSLGENLSKTGQEEEKIILGKPTIYNKTELHIYQAEIHKKNI